MSTCTECNAPHYAHGLCNRHYARQRRHGTVQATAPRGLALLDMLMARLPERPTDGCWEWGGTRDSAGYGRMKWQDKKQATHRLMFFAQHGRFPIETRHSCDNPPCCNPEHLLDGDRESNVGDRVARNRSARRTGRLNPNARYSTEQVLTVRQLWQAGMTGDAIAHQTGVNRNTVYRIKAGQK